MYKVTTYNSINFLPPYLQKQPLMQDLCFFIDYLNVDIESVYDDLRYKYIDWSKISEEGAVQTLSGMGMDYIIDLIKVIAPSNSTQLVALCSLIWLLKGQLLGVDIIASVCGFTYTYTVWHEQVPLGEPNTANINIDFVKYRALSEDFQYNFVEFLRKYLYPVISTSVDASPMEGAIYSWGVITCQEEFKYKEVQRYRGEPIIYNAIGDIANPSGNMIKCHTTGKAIKINTDVLWHDLETPWENQGYYAENGIWGALVNSGAEYVENGIHDVGDMWVCRVTPNIHYTTADPRQDIKMYIRYSDTGILWTNWVLLTEPKLITMRYCQFKAVFNNTQGLQMALYSFEVTIS